MLNKIQRYRMSPAKTEQIKPIGVNRFIKVILSKVVSSST